MVSVAPLLDIPKRLMRWWEKFLGILPLVCLLNCLLQPNILHIYGDVGIILRIIGEFKENFWKE